MLQHQRLLVLCAIALLSTGCGSNRPAVITNGTQLSDLWWAGELTDQAGNRWDVAIMPGMLPTFRDAGNAWSRSGERFTNYFDGDYWHQVGQMSKDCYAFAGTDCLADFVVSGIGDDYSSTSSTIGTLVEQKPFGWVAQITWRTLWGYVIKPIGRIPLGLVGSVGGVAAGTVLVPVAGVLYPPVVGAVDVAAFGIAVPAVRIVWNQVAWTVCLLNDEPDERQDGHWGLHIIQRPAGWKAQRQPDVVSRPPEPVVIDRVRMSRLVGDLVRLERSLALQAQHQRHIALMNGSLQRIDGSEPKLLVDDGARQWLDTEAAAECDRLLAEIRQRDPTLTLPARDEILARIRAAIAATPAAPATPAPVTPQP
ncbi:MAG: hypothetical protein AAB263_10310 [Planctomycetota bacterium]